MRTLSLLASSTETVFALGQQGTLVGRSHECDFPEAVKTLPICSTPKFEPDGTSYQIDQRVKAILQEGLSIYRVHADRLRELRPDVIITQIQCEVCAVSRADVEAAVVEWMMGEPSVKNPPKIVSLNPNSLEDIWTDIGLIAEALEVPDRGKKLVADLQGRMQEISERVLAQCPSDAPSVACIEWIDPLMAAGNWVPQLLEMLGAQNLFGVARQHSPWMKWEDLVAKDPDVIVILPCGFDIARTLKETNLLTSRDGWRDLRAVRNGRVYVVDGNQYMNRPGPRVVESLEIFSEILYPNLKRGRLEGSGWVRI